MKSLKIFTVLSTVLGLFSCTGTKDLYENSILQTDKKVSYEILKKLPAPVQRYFSYALHERHSYINYLRLKHGGRFKTSPDGEWLDIKGEQYFRAQPPGFIWIGKTKKFTAKDSYVDDKGKLKVYFLGFLRIVNKKGKSLNQAELLRWLGESIWMPTNLLPNENITWSAINDSTSKLTMNYDGISVYYNVHFNPNGQISKLETERYMEKTKKKWIGEVDDYKSINGMMLPTLIKASWILENKKYTYAEFQITEFDFNTPLKY